MQNLTNDDLVGKAFFSFLYNNQQEFFNKYFFRLNEITPKLKEFELKDLITGFYINLIRGEVRITYFVNKINKLIAEEEFKKISNNNKNNESPKEFPTFKSLFGSGYPDVGSLRGRQFLNTYAHIGLDLLEKLDAKSVYSLISRYRLKVSIDPKRKVYDDISTSKGDIKLTFTDVFKKYSNFFNKLDANLYSADDLWEDLARYQISFADNTRYSTGYFGHFLVNMFLIDDANALIKILNTNI